MAPYQAPEDWSETEIILSEYSPPKDWSETEIVLKEQEEQTDNQNSQGISGSARSDAENTSSRQVTDAVSKQVNAAASVSSSFSQVKAEALSEPAISEGSVAQVINRTVSRAVSSAVETDGSVAEILSEEVSEAVTSISSSKVGVASARQENVEESEPSPNGGVSRGPTVVRKTERIKFSATKVSDKNFSIKLKAGKLFKEETGARVSSHVKVKQSKRILELGCNKRFDNLQKSVKVSKGKTFCKKIKVDTCCKTDNKKLIKRLKAL